MVIISSIMYVVQIINIIVQLQTEIVCGRKQKELPADMVNSFAFSF